VARRVVTTVELTDDLDGSRADRTVTFGLEGTTYELDLNQKNARAFEKALAPYVAKARRVKARTAKGARPGTGRRSDLAEIRAWAKKNGHQVSDRGRIAGSIVDAFDAR